MEVHNYNNQDRYGCYSMATTIQVSEDVRRRLFSYINEKEKELGRRLSYNDAIKLLLEGQSGKMAKKDFMNHVAQFEGILDISDARSSRNKEKSMELRRDQHVDR